MSDFSDLELVVLEAVKRTGMPYELLEIDPSFSDTAAFCEKYGYSRAETCNTILVSSKKEPKKTAACVVLADSRLDVNKRVKKVMGVQKVSFASAEETIALTGMEIGGVTPFALPYSVPLYVADSVMTPDAIILGGGSRRLKIRVAPEALVRLGGEVIAELAIR